MASGGFTVAIDDITALEKAWKAQESVITSMSGQLASMNSEIAAAADEALDSKKSEAEKERIIALTASAQKAVNAAMSAVATLSGQLSQDAAKLSQTADTYQLAELMNKDHISSVAQLASYKGADAAKIQSLLKGESPQEQSQTEQSAAELAYPAAGDGGGGGGGGAGSGGGGGYSGGSGGSGGSGAGGGASSGGGGSAGGGAGGGATGTPVAPDMAATSAQVKSWVQQAIQILEQHGVPASKLDPNAIALIIQHESGGNPNAVNNWDSNAAAGHPSEGLMQTIGPTFSEYSLPGHGNILNPVDNIIAGCQYAISRYGSLDNVPGVVAVENGGSYVGY